MGSFVNTTVIHYPKSNRKIRYEVVDITDLSVSYIPLRTSQIDYLNKACGDSVISVPVDGGIQIMYNFLTPEYDSQLSSWSSFEIADPIVPSNYFPAAQVLAPVLGSSTNSLFASSWESGIDGRVYVFQGEFSTWSAQQVLLPPPENDRENYFGSSLAFDRTNYKTLFVGCGNCSSLAAKGHGAIFTYEQDLQASSWSQTQELHYTTLFNLGTERIKASGDLLLTDHYASEYDLSALPKRSTLLLRRSPEGEYHPEQILTTRFSSVTSFDVYDDTIVLSSNDESVKGNANAGAVYILGSAKLRPPAPGKPRPIRWSVQQVLYTDTPYADHRFGTDVYLDENHLSILSNDFRHANYIYEKDMKNGKWSLQQTLVTIANAGQSLLSGGTALSLGNYLNLYDEFVEADCLVLSLEDQFGDGWGDAYLVVTKPNGTTNLLQPRCDTTNPFRFRFCPRTSNDIGVYNFGIVVGVNTTNSWEILWRVYNENTGKWVVGNRETSLDYRWDAINRRFISVSNKKNLPANVTCTNCPARPTDKPSLRRRLKYDYETHHPTHTPAPTIDTDESVNWRIFKLIGTDSEQWFQDDHRGAFYYISDSKSRQLITSGTLCNPNLVVQECWLDLPDGVYNIRVGGALLAHSSSLTWSYCKNLHPFHSQTQITVKIEDEGCTLLGSHNLAAYCESADPAVVISIDLLIQGVAHRSPSISSSDISALAHGIAYAFPGLSPSDVKISTISSNSGLLISSQTTFRQSNFQDFDLLDSDGILGLFSWVESALREDASQTILSGLQSAQSKNIFYSSTAVTFVSAQIVGSADIPWIETEVEEVVSYSEQSHVDYWTVLDLNLISSMGFVVTGFTTLIVAALLITGRMKSKTPTHIPLSEDSNDQPISTKKTMISNSELRVLSTAELIELINDEDAALEIIRKRTQI